MRAQPILDRLEPLGFKTLGNELDFPALKQVPGRLPAAYVLPGDETADANRMGTRLVDQKITATFLVVLILPAVVRAGAMAKLSDDFETTKAAVIDAFVGWQHPDSARPSEYVSGAIWSVDGQALTYCLTFKTSYHIRKSV